MDQLRREALEQNTQLQLIEQTTQAAEQMVAVATSSSSSIPMDALERPYIDPEFDSHAMSTLLYMSEADYTQETGQLSGRL